MKTPEDLSFTVKELLSWMTAAYLLQVIEEPLRVFETHPGDGMYDCLTLMRPDGRSVISMNRNGESALVDGEVVSGIWALAGQTPGKGPRDLARVLIAESGLDLNPDQAPNGTALAAVTIANWLNLNRDQRVQAVPIWQYDGFTGGDVEQLSLLDGFGDIDGWLRQPPAIESLTSTSWLFALILDDLPVQLVNTRTGETRSDYHRRSTAAMGTRKTATGAPSGRWPAMYYDEDGDLACPIAIDVAGHDRAGQLTFRSIQPLHFAQRFAAHMGHEPVTVTQTPLFTVPASGFDWEPRMLDITDVLA